MLILIKLATWLLSPLGVTSSLLLLGLLLKRFRSVLLSIAVICLWGFSTYWLSQGILQKGLEDKARELQRESQDHAPKLSPRFIVVLGGGLLAASPPERPYPDLLTGADRVWHAARLFHSGRAERIILTGGQRVGLEGSGLQSEAEAMRVFLTDLGVPDKAILIEDRAQTTRENALRTLELIRATDPDITGLPEIFLVTSASHLPRATANYRRAGFQVVPEPAEFNAIETTLAVWEKILPNESNLATSSSALKEWIALAIGY